MRLFTLLMFLFIYSQSALAVETIKIPVKLNIGIGESIVVDGSELCRLSSPALHKEMVVDLQENNSGVFSGNWEHGWNFPPLKGRYLVRIRKFSQPNPRVDINIRIVDEHGKRLAEASAPSLSLGEFDFPELVVKAALNDDAKCPDAVWLTLPKRVL